MLILLIVLTLEPTPLKWKEYRPLADWLSTGLTITNVVAEGIDAKKDGKFKCYLLENGVGLGINQVAKNLVKRTRPDRSNNHSFYSAHSQYALVNSGWNLKVSIPFSISSGYLRMAADKHYMSDVGVGLLAGFLIGKICD